jgi:hypothetical protein
VPASGMCLSPALLSQLAQYAIGNSVFVIMTHSVIFVSTCFVVLFHDHSSIFIPCDFLPCAPVGSCILGPCVTMLISSLRMYSRSPCALLQVVLICFMFQTWYMVSYITCIVIYLVPQSEYRLGSCPSTLFPFLRHPPRSLGSPRSSPMLALPSRLRIW